MFCEQEEETVQHIISSYVFAQQLWHNLLPPIGLEHVTPDLNDICFAEWRKATMTVEKTKRKGFVSAVILGAWTFWNHTNMCVFDGISSLLSAAQHFFKEELQLWTFAGAQKLQDLFGAG